MVQECDQDFPKKRKWEELMQSEFEKSKIKYTKSIFDTELNLSTPLPFEWQRCLDIKSGNIYYINTKTNKKTSRDPRVSPEPPSSPKKMSLDLELNLPCGSSENTRKTHENMSKYKPSSTMYNKNDNSGGDSGGGKEGQRRGRWWEGGEMVTAVCKKCHMLVMMVKTSPSCPNCKYMHPTNQPPPRLFDLELSLFC